MSPRLDPPRTEKSARTRLDTKTTPGAFRGTDGSNPVPSSGESANFRSLAHAIVCFCSRSAVDEISENATFVQTKGSGLFRV
jgi:hypothetical protein